MSTVARIEEKLHKIGVKFAYVSMLSAEEFTICDVDADISFDLLTLISRAFGTTNINVSCDNGTSSDPCHEREIRVTLPPT